MVWFIGACLYSSVYNTSEFYKVLVQFIFTTSELKRIFSVKNSICVLPHEMPGDLKVRILKNYKILAKSHGEFCGKRVT